MNNRLKSKGFVLRSLDIDVFPEVGDLSLEEQKFPIKPGNAIDKLLTGGELCTVIWMLRQYFCRRICCLKL